MKKILILIVIIVVAVIAYKYATTTNAPSLDSNQVEGTTIDLEQEAATIDLSDIEADFGAELNAAVE